MKLTAEQLEARTVPAAAVWYWAGAWHIVDNGPVTATTLQLCDPALPQQAIDHPDAFVGDPMQPFVVFSDADNPYVLVAHADAVSNVVIQLGDPDIVVTSGASYQPGTTSGGNVWTTNTTATGATSGQGVQGGTQQGGGLYTTGSGGIVVDHHHGKHHTTHHANPVSHHKSPPHHGHGKR